MKKRSLQSLKPELNYVNKAKPKVKTTGRKSP